MKKLPFSGRDSNPYLIAKAITLLSSPVFIPGYATAENLTENRAKTNPA
jgi:hypothetical protein